MSIILDAGALIAVERGEREMIALLKAERRASGTPVTHGGVIGQVWRDGARQAVLARFLSAVDVRPLDEDLGKRCGRLLSLSRTEDVIDAGVVLLSVDGDDIYTSDPSDLAALASAAGLHVEVIGV